MSDESSSAPANDAQRRARGPAWFPLAVMALLAVRLLHFGPTIDEPHAWRQMDTAQYIRSFAEDGIDLGRPSVCWMGAYRTVVLECPLPEAAVALAMRVQGRDDLRLARAVFLLFFVAAAGGFHLLARRLIGLQAARWATLLYLAAPLSLAYSRAIHIDFAVLAAAHAALLFWLSGVERASIWRIAAGSTLGVLAALVKAPYLLPLVFALVPVAVARDRRGLVLRALPLFSLPLVAFLLWQRYAEAVNAAAPDWSFIPDYHRFTGMGTWYFGTVFQRLTPWSWKVLALRARDVVIGQAALPLLLAGVVMLGRRLDWRRPIAPADASVALWLLGGVCHVLLLFNLNVVHDYYQLPLVAPVALLAARPLGWLEQRRHAWALPALLMALITIGNVVWAERNFYQVQEVPTAAGALVRAHTPDSALVIASWWYLDARAPHVLYPAHRYGWSIREQFLTPALVERLRALGATDLALVRASAPVGTIVPYVARFPVREFSLPTGWHLYLYDLRAPQALGAS